MVKHRRILGKNAKFDSHGSSSLSLKTKNRTVFGIISFYWASDTFYWCLYSFLSIASTNCVSTVTDLCYLVFLPSEAAVWETGGAAAEPGQCSEEKRAGREEVNTQTQYDWLPEETHNYVNFDPLRCLCRRERLVYVGISVENIIPVSKSQRAWKCDLFNYFPLVSYQC